MRRCYCFPCIFEAIPGVLADFALGVIVIVVFVLLSWYFCYDLCIFFTIHVYVLLCVVYFVVFLMHFCCCYIFVVLSAL